ncbi:MAG: Flp pilus assembly protein CpaB [Acidimicrobiia bacterium]|nr:Flp pilus assembly protein CpaB [Acidimicrobiia bacterium]
MKNRRFAGLAAALLMAAVGTFALMAYVQSAKDKAVAGERMVTVLVAKEKIAQGTPVSKLGAAVKRTEVPAKVRAEGAVTSLDSLKGRVAATDLLAGEQIVAARFVTPDQARSGSVDVPSKLLQVSVALSAERMVGGTVAPGDTVAVFASFAPDVSPYMTHLTLHKVLVTAVAYGKAPEGGDDKEDDEKKGSTDDTPSVAPEGNLIVTFALDAPSAEKLVFAAEHGTVWLGDEPEDAPAGGTRVVKPENVYQ